MEYNIKQLINKDVLDKQIEINSDGYGGACVQVAINVMEFLDTFDKEFNIGYHPDLTTPHGIICKCDDQGGITGAMAGFARNTVAMCHEKGWKFYIADVLNKFNIDKDEKIDEVINAINKSDEINVSEEDVRRYVDELRMRWEKIKDED